MSSVMALDANLCFEVNSSAEFIPTAICLLKKYVTSKEKIVNSIHLTPDNSQQKAETEALISQFDLAIRRFESSLKPLDKKIDASIHSLSRYQKPVQGKPSPPSLPVNGSRQCSLVASTSTDEPINKAITQGNKLVPGLIWPVEASLSTCCPFCQRNSLTRSSLCEHINEKHPKHNEVYENISSLTPEFMLATEKTISGNRQCFYCSATFRSNAPLFRHIQEAHVAYFDIFVNISLVKGDTMQCLKSNNANRVTPGECSIAFCLFASHNTSSLSSCKVGTLHPIQSSITRAPAKPAGDRKYQVLTPSTAPVCIESLVDASHTVTHEPTISAISTPQNARKSIRTSTITRFSPIAAISSTQSADDSISVQAATVKVASSTTPKVTEPIHSARKRRIITCNMPAPASKKVAAIAHASGLCSLSLLTSSGH